MSSSTLVLTTNLTGQSYKDLQSAARQWNRALGKPAVKIKQGPVSSSTTTMDGINSIKTGELESNKLGLTEIHTKTTTDPKKGTSSKSEVDIVIKPVNDRDIFKATALHEIGHALGAGHINNSDAIMNASLEIGGNSTPPTKLTSADIKAVKNARKGNNIDYSA